MNESDARLEDLITRHLGAELDAHEEQELASRLAESPAARALFASYMRIEGATLHLGMAGCLSRDGQPSAADHSPQPSSSPEAYGPVRRGGGRTVARAMMALAGCLAIGLGVYLFGRWREAPSLSLPAADGITVAELVRAVNVQWQNTGMPTSVGSALPPGTISLASGLVEIAFGGGATVILEGPADLDLIARDRAFLHRGRLRGMVPDNAETLTIGAADMTVADPGVEFGFQVDEAGNAELHVFDGEVRFDDDRSSAVTGAVPVIKAGSAVRIDTAGQRFVIDADDSSFVGTVMFADVAETNIKDLKEQFKNLKRREAQLTKDVRQTIARLAETPELIAIHEEIQATQMRLADFLAENNAIAEAESRLETAQTELNKMLDKKVSADESGRALRKEIGKWNAQLKDLKQEIKSVRGSPDTARYKALMQARQQASKTCSDAQDQLRRLRQELRQQDPEIQVAARRLNEVRKAIQGLPNWPQLRDLRADLAETQKSRDKLRKRLQREDKDLRGLRAELKLIGTRLQKTKTEIRDANTAARV